jgi:hypothetical protein
VPAGLRAERQRIHEYGQQYGANAVWVDEIIEPSRGITDPFEAIDDFLYGIGAVAALLGLGRDRLARFADHRRYRTRQHHVLRNRAVLCRGPWPSVVVIHRADITLPPDTAALLELLRSALPRVAWLPVRSSREAEDVAKRVVDDVASGRHSAHPSGRELGSILYLWWRWREPSSESPGLRWLDRRWISPQRRPEPSVVEESLRLASTVGSERQRLCRLWIAARELMGVPYDSLRDEYWLTQWNRFLRRWNNSAAWYGLHGHAELGYLSALHSLDDVCQGARSANRALVDDPDWDRPLGSLGSAYYAAAKRVASRAFRRRGLRKALGFLDQATFRDAVGHSNVLAVRGSVLHALHAYAASVDTYRAVLRLREKGGATSGAVGEAMAELGFGLLFVLRWPEALSRLREGVRLMEDAGYGAGFLVRAKRKYATGLVLTGQILEARRQRVEAQELARRASIGTAG